VVAKPYSFQWECFLAPGRQSKLTCLKAEHGSRYAVDANQ
jgi:hypothetical protein